MVCGPLGLLLSTPPKAKTSVSDARLPLYSVVPLPFGHSRGSPSMFAQDLPYLL